MPNKPTKNKQEECKHLIGGEVHEIQECLRCGLTLEEILREERSRGYAEAVKDGVKLLTQTHNQALDEALEAVKQMEVEERVFCENLYMAKERIKELKKK